MPRIKEPATRYIVDKQGKKTDVVLPVEEYERLLEDIADLSAIASRKNERTIPWETVKKKLKKNGRIRN